MLEDAPWEQEPDRTGKLLSIGVTRRNIAQALRLRGPVVVPPVGSSHERTPEDLEDHLRASDLLWGDLYPGPTEDALRVRARLGLPLPAILHAWGAMPKAAEAMLFPWQHLLRPGDGLLFSCEADRQIWRRLVQESRLGEWVAPLPVDDALFHPRPAHVGLAFRRAVGIRAGSPLLLYVGRLNIQKNLHSLLYLLAKVREQIEDACLCVVGPEDDVALGEFGVSSRGYADRLKRTCAELGLSGAVRWIGPLFGDDLARAYAAVDVLVNLGFYHRENFGLAQAEAHACGLPVVCSAWGGFKDVVEDRVTGFLVDAVLTKRGIRVDWRSAAQSVVRLLTDDGLREQMRLRALARAQSHHILSSVSSRLHTITAAAVRQAREAAPEGAPYEPTDFARSYEAHKRARGWYAGTPRMFQGRDYTLYERMFESYASQLAAGLQTEDLQSHWIPYFSSTTRFDPVGGAVQADDPVWPYAAAKLPVQVQAVCAAIDGRRDVEAVAHAVIQDAGGRRTARGIRAALCWLYRAGLVLFVRSENTL